MARKSKETKDILTSFLEESPTMAEAVAPSPDDALLPPMPSMVIITAGVEDMKDPIKTILADLCKMAICSKDFHYHSFGTPFYGLHELADIIWKVQSLIDDLIEAYYLGEKGVVPPLMQAIYQEGVSTLPPFLDDKNKFILRLLSVCHNTIDDVEMAKKVLPDVKAGVHAVLDAISQHALVSAGLLCRTLDNAPKSLI